MGKKVLSALGAIAALGLGAAGPARAETVMQQCGHQYQTAKAAGTLNGMTWNQYRSDCAARLKAEPASTATTATPAATAPAAAAPAATAPAATAANPLNPAPAAPASPTPAPAAATASTPSAPAKTPAGTASTGRSAFFAREKQCGAEWRANKATLVAQTPGLTWPKYLSQCNARLKSAGK